MLCGNEHKTISLFLTACAGECKIKFIVSVFAVISAVFTNTVVTINSSNKSKQCLVCVNNSDLGGRLR